MKASALFAASVLSVCWTDVLGAQIETYELHGDVPGFFGANIDRAGDVNADGWLDWIVEGEFDPLIGGGNSLVYVHSGLDGQPLLTLHGDAFSDQYANSVAGVGDVDGDGHDDVAVGDRFSDHHGEHSGRVWVYSGRGGAVLYTFDGDEPFDGFGRAVARAGDVDGDGRPDILTGTGKGWAYARVYSGRDGSLLHELHGTSEWDAFSQTLAGIGDVDLDGHDDFAVGARDADPQGSGSGSVFVYSGANASLLFRIDGTAKFQHLGSSLAAAGDVDADGRPDVIVGAPQAKTQIGQLFGCAWVFSGSNGSLLHTFFGAQTSGYFGCSVAGLGDVDGDGFGDVAAGARFEGAVGRVYVHSGRDGALLALLNGAPPSVGFGYAVAGAGDLNRDRLGDLLVGAVYTSNDVGRLHVFTSFHVPPPTTYCTAKVNSQGCTPQVRFEGAPTVLIGGRPLTLIASEVVNQTSGVLTWGFAADATPFAGGWRCVDGAARVLLPDSGGDPFGVDCSGSFTFAFSDAYLALHGLGPGHALFAQFHYLDPTHPDGTGIGLTDALGFTLGF